MSLFEKVKKSWKRSLCNHDFEKVEICDSFTRYMFKIQTRCKCKKCGMTKASKEFDKC